ncbi:7-cyano-7-deazaguanine synthase [Roseovarius sp.]|uniref:7-cyano-7-deazaguanine synthase n=1 Tax=Roseovarius sp. TaxID=1486281 RepID=UPI0035642E32
MTVTAAQQISETAIDLLEPGATARAGHRGLAIDAIGFSTASLETYAFADREPVVLDAMLVAAAVEYADRTVRRPAHGWRRTFALHIPVHDAARWQAGEVRDALIDAVGFLTGDDWSFEFSQRITPSITVPSAQFDLSPDTRAVIAYSDGMDSRAVAGLVRQELGDRLVKVRLGTGTPKRRRGLAQPVPFAGVPYELSNIGPNRDSTARNRGFKFSSIAGVAAYLSGAAEIIIPESGQGAIGPALVGVAHAYPDYRNHPVFARKMERYFRTLFGRDIRFRFPRLWHTKGQTLREYATLPEGHDWWDTRSCWRGSRWLSIAGEWRQCGVCAACMLRRMSVHAAGLCEPPDLYAAIDLTAPNLAAAVDQRFRHAEGAFAEYAHAGFLHLDHLADMAEGAGRPEVRVHAAQVGLALGASVDETETHLRALLEQHKTEWETYMDSLGTRSFLAERRRGKL